ncbi:transposition [Cordylochernes scorpioides]|uniref:Transposition n=1 Tax=Cordylochernes scorpioides TaxID=51811 RepID=A0ABY6L8Z5_9ARAC|nr:transposition [Cordylochernes scorpioides]
MSEVRSLKRCDSNSRPWSVVIVAGTPYLEIQPRKKAFATLIAVLSEIGKASGHFEYLSIAVKMWVQFSEWDCQKSKIHRHTITKHGIFPLPSTRFEHVHLDLIGPLPHSENCTHILTAIDRYSKWPEAFPISDKTAISVAKAFFRGWISRYGVPATITTDQGREFESHLFKDLTSLIGTNACSITSGSPFCGWHGILGGVR